MKITAQEEYGLRCLLRLASTHGGQALTIPEIAAAERLSAPYVAKLLSIMRQAGLIESTRGRTGGYHLTLSPADMRLGLVMRALGEPLFEDPSYCEKHAGPETVGPCVHHDNCTLRSLWQTLDHWMRHVLDRVTLADLMQNEGRIAELLNERVKATRFDDNDRLVTLLPLSRE